MGTERLNREGLSIEDVFGGLGTNLRLQDPNTPYLDDSGLHQIKRAVKHGLTLPAVTHFLGQFLKLLPKNTWMELIISMRFPCINS